MKRTDVTQKLAKYVLHSTPYLLGPHRKYKLSIENRLYYLVALSDQGYNEIGIMCTRYRFALETYFL